MLIKLVVFYTMLTKKTYKQNKKRTAKKKKKKRKINPVKRETQCEGQNLNLKCDRGRRVQINKRDRAPKIWKVFRRR